MAFRDRKGGGLVAETLETGALLVPPQVLPAPPAAVVSSYSAGPAPRSKRLSASIAAAIEQRRLFLLVPFAMIGGLIAAVELPIDPPPLALAAGAAAIGLMLVLSLKAPIRLRLALLLAAAWLGFSLLPLHGTLFGTQMLARPTYGTYQARVDEILSETATEKRVILSAITPAGTGRAVLVRRARVLIKAGPDLAPGDMIAGEFRFAPVPGPVFPGGFDTQFHSYFEGIGAYGNAVHPPAIVAQGDAGAPAHIVDAIRRGISDRIDAVLAQPAAGIARAIVNGDQSAVSDDARTTMATAGIAHVLSVSGLHLTIVAGGVFWVVRLLLATLGSFGARLPVKRIAALAGIASALFYFGISGGNVAALRSTLMIVLVFGAVLFGRRALTMRNVAIAAIIVIIVDPASVFRPSFQLSFAAVVALVGAYENLRSERAKDAGLLVHTWRYAKGVALTSVIAGAATLLFSIYHFQQTSPLGVLGNLATLPLVGFIMMPAAAIAMLLMPLGLDAVPLQVMGWSIERMLDLARVVADWSTHLRAAPLLTPWALAFGVAGLAWFGFFRDRWRLLGPVLVVPLVALFAVDGPPDVLVSDTTQALVVRGPSGLQLADGKPQSFALDVWRETYGEPINASAVQQCDSLACVGTGFAGFSYAIVRDPAALPDECGRADLLVVRGTMPAWCTGSTVVSATDLAAYGVAWLKWHPSSSSFEVRHAIPALGRSWRIAR